MKAAKERVLSVAAGFLLTAIAGNAVLAMRFGFDIGIAPMPYLSAALGSPPAILGFRSERHAEAACLVPGAEVVVEPRFVTELLPEDPGDVFACGPEPMLEAVRELVPSAQLAWEAPMACGYGACYGCVVEIDGHYARLCVDGPVLHGGTHGSPMRPLLERAARVCPSRAPAGHGLGVPGKCEALPGAESPASPASRGSQLDRRAR